MIAELEAIQRGEEPGESTEESAESAEETEGSDSEEPEEIEGDEGEESDEDSEDEESDEDEDEELDEEEPEDDEPEDDEPEDDEPEDDPKAAKGLDRLQRQEKRFKERMAAERAEVASERKELESIKGEAQGIVNRWQELKELAKYDYAGLLEAFDVPLERFAEASKQIYYADPNAKGGNKEITAQSMQTRRLEARIAEQDRKIQELNSAREAEATQRQVDQYLGGITRAVSEETPLAQAFIDKNPAKAKQDIHQIAVYLAEEFGEAPDAEDVLKAYERQKRTALEDMGVDPDEVIGRRPAKAKAKKLKGKPSKTLSASGGGRTRAEKPDHEKTPEELREETLAELDKLLG